jgi:hypothetical protein
MPILPDEAMRLQIPALRPVRQIFPDDRLEDAAAAVGAEFSKESIRARVRPGMSVAVLVGSRGVASLREIVKASVDSLKALGARPFIVPAMGSHGGGLAGPQRAILEGYGVTEGYVGAPLECSMDTVVIGRTPGGVPVHIDAIADRADAIVPIARVKVHTDFDAPIESGLCKMLAIGLGKHNGCARLHQEGFSAFGDLIPEAASVVLEKKYIALGVAIIENAHEHVHSVHAVPGPRFLEDEPGLLSLSRRLMPRLQFDEIDVLVIEQIGKDISGAGMDPNIVGRMSTGPIEAFGGPAVKRIVLLGLSPGTHGNAVGIGLADFATDDILGRIDMVSTYANCVASGNPEAGKIPVMLPSEGEAIRAALQCAARIDREHPRIVKIKDTLHLIDILVSDSLFARCMEAPDKFELHPA